MLRVATKYSAKLIAKLPNIKKIEFYSLISCTSNIEKMAMGKPMTAMKNVSTGA